MCVEDPSTIETCRERPPTLLGNPAVRQHRGTMILFHDGVGNNWQPSDTPQCSTGVGFIALDTIFSVIGFSAALGVGLREDPDSVDVAVAIGNGAEALLFAISSQVGTSRRRKYKRAIKEHDAWQVRMWQAAEASQRRNAEALEHSKHAEQRRRTAELGRRGLEYQLADGVVLFVRRGRQQLQVSFAEGAPAGDVTLFADDLEIEPEKVTHAKDGEIGHVVFRV